MNMPIVWQVLLLMGCFRNALIHIWGVPKSTPHFHSLFRKGGQKVAKTETQKKKDFAFSLILSYLQNLFGARSRRPANTLLSNKLSELTGRSPVEGIKKEKTAWSSLFWCPEQDLNLHSFRNTHLKRARLPIPPPGLVEVSELLKP